MSGNQLIAKIAAHQAKHGPIENIKVLDEDGPVGFGVRFEPHPIEDGKWMMYFDVTCDDEATDNPG